MIKVVTGAGASGKSSFAESLLEQSEAKRKIYAATMIVWDDECRARVKKHRQMRKKRDLRQRSVRWTWESFLYRRTGQCWWNVCPIWQPTRCTGRMWEWKAVQSSGRPRPESGS